MRVRFAGFGGQGIVLAAQLLGLGAILDDKKALQTSSYGSAARGGNCAGDVTIEKSEIFEILPEKFDVMVVMSQPAYEQYIPRLKEGGALIYDADLVTHTDNPPYECYGYPATKEAQHTCGNKLFANIMILGYTAGIAPEVSSEALRSAIKKSIKSRFLEANLEAFEIGFTNGTKARNHR